MPSASGLLVGDESLSSSGESGFISNLETGGRRWRLKLKRSSGNSHRGRVYDVLVFGRMIFLSTPDDIIFGTAQGLRAALPRSINKVGLSPLERELCAAETTILTC